MDYDKLKPKLIQLISDVKPVAITRAEFADMIIEIVKEEEARATPIKHNHNNGLDINGEWSRFQK